MTKKHVSLLVVFVLLFTTLFTGFVFAADETEWEIADDITINVKAHVQTFGDQTYTDKGEIAFGTEGKAKRLEKFDVTLEGAPADMELVGMAHVQSFGDMPKTGFQTGAIGTSGLAKRIEGVAFKLVKKGTDTLYPGYRVAYAVHMQSFGWGISNKVNEVVAKNFDGAEDFAFDGTFAGTRGLSKRIESVSLIIERVADLRVLSVSAANSKDIVIEFNKDVDEFTAVNESLYEVKVNNQPVLATTDYDVEVDGSTAYITLVDAKALHNGDVVSVKVKKGVLDTNLKGMAADYSVVLPMFSDRTAPSIVKVETAGNDVVVTFDDYIAAMTDLANVVKFNGSRLLAGSYTIDGKALTLTGKNLPSLAAGTYAVSVSNIADLAGNVASFLTGSLVVTNDYTVPTFVSIAGKSTNTFAIKFNKTLAVPPTVTVKKNGYNLTVATPVVDGADSTIYNVTVSDNAGIVTVYNSSETSTYLEVGITGIKDTKNTIGAPVTTGVTLVKDTTGPSLILGNSAIATDNINIQFNEVIAAVDSTKIIVTDKDGIRLTLDAGSPTIEDDARYGIDTVLRLTKTGLVTGTYSITLGAGAVQDASGNKNAAVSLTLTKSGASTTDITGVGVTTIGNVIEVDYNVAMGDSARTAANYKIDGASLPTGSILYFYQTKEVVRIELPASSVVKSEAYVLSISDEVLSAADAKVAAAERNKIVNLIDNVSPVLVSAKKLTSTTVELTFNENLGTVAATWADDFVVKVNGVAITNASVAAGSPVTKLVLTVSAYNVDQDMTVTVGGSGITLNTVDTIGNVVASGTTVLATK